MSRSSSNSKTSEKPLTKRQLQAKASREKIFKTAQLLFSEKGYNNVSVADICKEAGVSVGLFYNYFKSKSDISIESLARFTEDWSVVTSTFLPGDSAIDRLLRLTDSFLHMTFKNPTAIQNARVQYSRDAQGIPPFVFDNTYATLPGVVHDILVYGKENGQILETLDETLFFRTYYTYLIGTTVHLLNYHDRDKLISHSVEDLSKILPLLLS